MNNLTNCLLALNIALLVVASYVARWFGLIVHRNCIMAIGITCTHCHMHYILSACCYIGNHFTLAMHGIAYNYV